MGVEILINSRLFVFDNESFESLSGYHYKGKWIPLKGLKKRLIQNYIKNNTDVSNYFKAEQHDY